MNLPHLTDFVVIFGLAVAVIFACHRLRVPAIVGLLITGVLAGPYGLGLISATHEVEIMAEVGVVMLLFTIGLELSLKDLVALRRPVLLGGATQVGGSIAVLALLALAWGQSGAHALFIGFLASLSSTAIVLKLWQERAEMDAPHGRVGLSILIFQDIVIVPLMLLTPFLAGKAGALGPALAAMAGKAALVLAVVLAVARWVAPMVLRAVVATRSRELFLLTTLALCLATAMLTSQAGLSLSLGAFLAGLAISESEYHLSALEGIMPFRDVFTSLFFVSVGMLLDMNFLVNNLALVLLATGAVLVVKAALVGAVVRWALGYPSRPAFLVGMALCQVGEFSFILAKSGYDLKLLDESLYQLFLAASICTMALTPFLMSAASRVVRRWPQRSATTVLGEPDPACPMGLCDHLIIVGFGVGGRNLARAARSAGIRYVVLEMNPDTVRKARREGEPIMWGDAGHLAVLEHVGLTRARVLATVIADPAATRRITEVAKKGHPAIHIIARTRFVSEIVPLTKLGADHVVAEEFEISIEIFHKMLRIYLVPQADIEKLTSEIRAEGYEMLRSMAPAQGPLADLEQRFLGMEVSGLGVEDGSPMAGRTLEESALRKRHGLSVVAVRRGGQTATNPDGTFRLQAGDIAYVFGSHDDVASAGSLFAPRRPRFEDICTPSVSSPASSPRCSRA